MNKTTINRHYLYKYVSENIGHHNKLFQNIEFIRSLFYDSATLIAGMEDGLENDFNKGFSDFEKLFDKNVRLLSNTAFKENILAKYRKRIFDSEGKKEFDNSYDGWVSFLISSIAKYQNLVLKQNYKNNSREMRETIDYRQMPKTFLSYAFDDKGLSFALYLYFLNHGGFLFVDWMWNGKITDSYLLKQIISNEIKTSNQFLFVRTTASELRVKGNYTIKQWCSWEIGNFYDVNKDNKFMIAFYDSNTNNQILETFKIMKDVEEGAIIPA